MAEPVKVFGEREVLEFTVVTSHATGLCETPVSHPKGLPICAANRGYVGLLTFQAVGADPEEKILAFPIQNVVNFYPSKYGALDLTTRRR